MKPLRIVLPLLALLVLRADAAQSTSWVAVPLETRIADAELVVIGEIVAVEDVPSRALKRGKLRITEVIKGHAAPKEVILGWIGPKEVIQPDGTKLVAVVGGATRYKLGDKGIWVLNPRQGADCYEADYPGNRMDMKSEKQVRAIARKMTRPGVDSLINGLQITLEGVKDTYDPSDPIIVQAVLTNTTNKTITIVDNRQSAKHFKSGLVWPEDMTRLVHPQFMVEEDGDYELTLLPGTSYRRPVTLTDWFGIQKDGQYKLMAQYRNDGKQKGDRWAGTLQTAFYPFAFKPLGQKWREKVAIHAKAIRDGDRCLVQFVVKNDSDKPFAMTLESVERFNGSASRPRYKPNRPSEMPKLFEPHETAVFTLTDSVEPHQWDRKSPLQYRLIIADFEGNRHALITQTIKFPKEKDK